MPTDPADRVWLCTHCWEEGRQPKFIILDGTYGSAPCRSIRCGGEKRIFHKELRHVLSTEPSTTRERPAEGQ